MRLDGALTLNDPLNRAAVETIGHRDVNVHRLSGEEQISSRLVSEICMHMQPKSPVSSAVIDDQDDRESLASPQAEITSADHPRDGFPVGKQRQIICCFDLEENDSSLDFAVGVESRHNQIVAIIALHALYGAAAQKHEAFQVIDTEVRQHVFARAQLPQEHRYLSSPGDELSDATRLQFSRSIMYCTALFTGVARSSGVQHDARLG
jgi:hypothetical protein